MTPSVSPKAVLFDVGGVLLQFRPRKNGLEEFVPVLLEHLHSQGVSSLPSDRVELDLRSGVQAYHAWKFAQSRRANPRELPQAEFWGDFVAADWPAAARAYLKSHALELSADLERALSSISSMPGAGETVRAVRAAGIRTGVVSNTICSVWTRRTLESTGIADYLECQVYSDEAGFRKPSPMIFQPALLALDVRAEEVWYVGDKLDRDTQAARRAGIGKMILMPSEDSGESPPVFAAPDVVIRSLPELLAHLPGALQRS